MVTYNSEWVWCSVGIWNVDSVALLYYQTETTLDLCFLLATESSTLMGSLNKY